MGIRDKGIAQKVIAGIEYEALSEDTLREVSALGFPVWFTDYLNYIVSHGLGSKENLIISAYGLLHKIAKKKWIGILGAKSYDSSQRDKALQIAMDERLAEGRM